MAEAQAKSRQRKKAPKVPGGTLLVPNPKTLSYTFVSPLTRQKNLPAAATMFLRKRSSGGKTSGINIFRTITVFALD
jgi:hypothetical protein